MATIKYDINGKANLKPIDQTITKAEGLAKKIAMIDTTLKGFIGIKVFAEVGKTINNSLKEYDKFKAALNEETNLTKQFKSLQTSLSGTLGTVRDQLSNSFSNIFGNGNNFIDTMKDVIPKIGANLIATMKVLEAIVLNVKTNFNNIIKPESWNKFFVHAKSLATNFCLLFGNLLRDAFTFAVDNLKWSLKDFNIVKIIFNPLMDLSWDLQNMIQDIFPGLRNVFDPVNFKKLNVDPRPKFGFGDGTQQALRDMASELGQTFKEGLNVLAGQDAGALFNKERNSALKTIEVTIDKMNTAIDDTKEGVEKIVKGLMDGYKNNKVNTATENISNSTSAFKSANSNISNILGDLNNPSTLRIKDVIKSLNSEFETTNKTMENLFNKLKSAKTVNEIEEIFTAINAGVIKVEGLTHSMNQLQREAERAKIAGDLLAGVLGSIGELGTIIQMIISGNPIGLLIELISRLVGVFSSLSNNATGVLNCASILFDIVEQIMDDLGPVIDNILRPIMDIIQAAGIILGVLLRTILPIIEAILSLTHVFDILKPLLQVVTIFIALLADAIGAIWNVISWILNKITFGLIDLGQLAVDNTKRAFDAFSQEVDVSDYKDNSSSYNVSGDLYINIYVDKSCVVGNIREIALALRDEIRIAEKAGY
jgi:hypothetical protein